MKRRLIVTVILGVAVAAPLLASSGVMTYQGRVQSGGTDFNGTGQFKFALVTGTNVSAQATATANLTLQFVTSYNLTFGGNGYVTPPAVSLSSQMRAIVYNAKGVQLLPRGAMRPSPAPGVNCRHSRGEHARITS